MVFRKPPPGPRKATLMGGPDDVIGHAVCIDDLNAISEGDSFVVGSDKYRLMNMNHKWQGIYLSRTE